MHFNWIMNGDQNDVDKKSLIDLEYRLRPRITRFLMERLEQECSGDFSSFHFDVDMVSKEIRIADKTPQGLAIKVSEDFKNLISSNCC